jgi:nitric oxide reductase NorD protein
VGVLKPEAAEAGLGRRRESRRIDFQRELTRLIQDLPEPQDIRLELPEPSEEVVADGHRKQRREIPEYLMVNDQPVPIPEALQQIIKEIYEDLGSVPNAYLTVAHDMTGHYFHSPCQAPEGTGYFLSEHAEGVHVFDEWDYRRQGYRKRWALLRESDAEEGDLSFAKQTMDRFQGMTQQIRKRFACIRQNQALLRRQKEGDEVDLDAAVEALSDMKAGRSPSERVFVRLSRERRDIAAAFLIDVSGSTSGWINETERMALLILSEAMEQIEDRFAIYGFSGQTRKRCELYRIKGFDEPYGDRIKKRIAGIRPREYTRMGPPIRRLTDMLIQIDARLLLTLSDGKPDDYDAYNGDYGIEDTRQALLEAKRNGIHPFCITIDKAEHSYLAHMYGHASYVFIDDLSQLPLKIPEIYRKLTT